MLDIIKINLKADCRRMAQQKNKPRTAVAERLIRLRKAHHYDSTTAMAKFLKVSIQRISNVENGKPLGRDLADIIVKKFHGVTTDWLWYGYTDGLSVRMFRLLEGGESSADVPLTKTKR